MTKTQKNLIGILFSIFLFAVLVFRTDLLNVQNRPRINFFLVNYLAHWGISVSFLLFAYFLGKTLKVKWWIFILILLFVEINYIFILNYGPKTLPDRIKLTKFFTHFKKVALVNRPLIQFDSNCARYDSVLFYTLKPGKSTFGSYEFNNTYEVNSKGFRDTEGDLHHPEVLFLGDSFTMGWGVDQDKTFASVFEQKSGLKCLNTGISSYGTARESFNLGKTDADSLKLIVVQFHDTDLEENSFWIKNKRLGSKTQADFNVQLKNNEKIKKYYLFKYLKDGIITLVTPNPRQDPNKSEKVLVGDYEKYPNFLEDFYKICAQMREKFKGPIIFTFTGSFYTEKAVVDAFKAFAESNNIENVYFVNLGTKLNEKHYFYLDDHLNQKGHQMVAEELLKGWGKIKIPN
jgi:hypothetical protein